MRKYVSGLVVAAFAVIGLAGPASASPSCIKNPLACVNGVVCTVAAQAGLQCVD